MATPAAAAAASAMTISDFTDDVLDEIMVRLPSQASLPIAAAVSRTWTRVCTTPDFLRRFRRRHPSPPLLGMLRAPGGRIAYLRVVADDDARRRGDLAPSLAGLGRAAHDLRRFRSYLDLHVVDHRDGRLLLKPRPYSMLFVYDMTLGPRRALVEVRWPAYEVFQDHMVSYLLDGGDVLVVRKAKMDLRPVWCDHCHYYSAATKEWRVVRPWCRDAADAAMYARCRYNIIWTERAGDVVYTLCSHCPAESTRSLVALDTKTMERSLVELPRYLRPSEVYNKERSFTIMEMVRDAGGIGLVAVDNRRLILRVWLRHGDGGGVGEEWTLHRKVRLMELARQITEEHQVHLIGTKVVAARRGVLHLRLEAMWPPAVAVERQSVSFFASLELESMSFSNVHQEDVVVTPYDKYFLYTLPWRWSPPFLPPQDHC